jgi:hypothetical protein
MRIGTTDRDRAMSALGRHFSDGRLDLDELEERSGLAATARTTAELARLFSDLPGGLPAAVAAPQVHTRPPGRSNRPGTAQVILLIVILLVVGAAILTGHGWLLILVLAAARCTGWRHLTRDSLHATNRPGYYN